MISNASLATTAEPITNSIGMKLTLVLSGEFMMGSKSQLSGSVNCPSTVSNYRGQLSGSGRPRSDPFRPRSDLGPDGTRKLMRTRGYNRIN